MKGSIAKNVDDYIAEQPVDHREILESIRHLVLSVAKDAEEVISYRLPCYKLNGMLVGFGTHKKGCSFYTMSTTILGEHADELTGFHYEGSTLHLPLGQKLPVTLLKKLIRKRMQMNQEKAMRKQHAQKR
ncbi:MAG: DUF1801 domain-containing protein [Bacteroidota bacterium]